MGTFGNIGSEPRSDIVCLEGNGARPSHKGNGYSSGVNEGCVVIENHPNDSRVKLSKDNVVQALTSRMGTGGGNVPLVMEKK